MKRGGSIGFPLFSYTALLLQSPKSEILDQDVTSKSVLNKNVA